MPIWLSILFSIIGVIGTMGGICGFTAYFGEKAKHKAKKRIAEEEKQMADLEKLKHQAFIEDIKKVVGEVIEPLAKDVSEIKTELAGNKKATIAGLRATMKELRDKYIVQGYADIGDKATWNELHDDYKDMGGNHFKEYVNQWREDVNSLPLNKKVSKTKQKLVENK